jgi:hypothetical protein
MPTLPPSEVIRICKMRPTIPELRIIDLMRDYKAIRNAYFGESIPPVEEVILRFLPRDEIARLSGFDDKDTDGLCSFGKFSKSIPCLKSIVLADDLKTSEIRITLLHEMAHMKVDRKFDRAMGHGKNFKKEVRRLMAAGAFDNWV